MTREPVPLAEIQGAVLEFLRNRDDAAVFGALAMLLLAFPELKVSAGPVRDRLVATEADSAVLASWEQLVAQKIAPADEDDEF